MTGHVSIVGAGPGDPELLTRKAVTRLRAADLVLYDALVDTRVLDFAKRAQRFFVGKRAGRHAISQPAIHALMIRAARKGKRVVRLKGGDPYVFGRGGEEALALRAAGVPFDVVPGITSAVAAPALAGIPVTHRGLASAFLVVSGHDEAVFASAIGQLQPNGVTLVVLMGLGRSGALACHLIDRGWARGTPSAVIVDASTPRQQTWYGRLDALAQDEVAIDGDGPGTLVIGAVAALDLACEAAAAAMPAPARHQRATASSPSAGGGAPGDVKKVGPREKVISAGGHAGTQALDACVQRHQRATALSPSRSEATASAAGGGAPAASEMVGPREKVISAGGHAGTQALDACVQRHQRAGVGPREKVIHEVSYVSRR